MCCGFNEMLAHGRMSQSIRDGLIYLIPKGDDPFEDIKKWRPITMLNTIYKIFATALTQRLQPLLNGIIHTSQSLLSRKDIFWTTCLHFGKCRHQPR